MSLSESFPHRRLRSLNNSQNIQRTSITSTRLSIQKQTPQNAPQISRSKRSTPWTGKRLAPFQKTPASRNLRTPRNIVSSKPRKKRGRLSHDLPLRHFELLNKTWRLYRVSPMFKFKTECMKLRHYSVHLASHIKAEVAKGLAVDAQVETADAAQFSLFSGLKIQPDESEAVEITLKQKPSRGSGEKEPRVVLTAILCCVGAPSEDLRKVHSDFTQLPLMLVKGPVTLTSYLTQFLELQFDCHVSPVVFSTCDLSWMLAMWAGFSSKTGNRKVQLSYSVPASIQGLDNISMEINSDDCLRMWKYIHDENDESFHASEVVCLIKSLEEHFVHHFGINLAAMNLYTVGTASAFVGAEGKLKVFSVSHLPQVLSHITKLMLEKNLTQ
ncbi:hypothetical protein CAPTEDRAFT_224521 [Capitella teleta]|uniref:Centromere protein L n=1 Tax=Capitella teleta TaxID=283909 RepID=R7U123_CAPTE|nr:hypothetical protein CAPTEDRAFT_224521 [Capitella teleta]|eukprot:ELT96885.1 hypothetical protein CAPTEDRAFT_224521 [Capitella teleta]